jgi:hypothetical protein
VRKKISRAAHGMDFNVGAAFSEMPAQAMHVDFDSIRGDFSGAAKQVVLDQSLQACGREVV